MHTEHHRWFSPALGHDMELKVYGHYGQPIVVFPAQDGRYYDFENFKMIEACANLLERGRIKIIAVDSVDWQSWTNAGAHPAQRAQRHLDYKLSHQQALERAGQMLCHHEGIMGVFAKAIGNYGYILRCPDEAALIATAEAMLEKR